MAARGTHIGLTRIVVYTLLLGALSIFGFCATGIFGIGLVGVFFIGAATVLGGTGTQTLMQHAVDGAMRGRVMSLYGMIYRGVPALGAMLMGAAAEFVGFQWALASGGVICLIALLWILPRSKAVTHALEGEQTAR